MGKNTFVSFCAFLRLLFVDVIDYAAVIVSQEKSVGTVIKNVRWAAVDLSDVEKSGDEVFDGSGFRNSYNTITPLLL